MTARAKRFWADLTFEECGALDGARAIAVLPVGAVEQHGPHLPLSVDWRLTEAILGRAVELMPSDLPALVLPTLPVGTSNEHIAFPGTLTLTAETLIRLWTEIGESVARAGVRKLVLFNGHGGQVQIMDIVARDLRVRLDLLVVASSWFTLGLPEGMFDQRELRHGIHAGDLETSMMLAVAPETVRVDRARDFRSTAEDLADACSFLSIGGPAKLGWQAQDLNPRGACGNAAAATAEKGRAVIDFVARRFVALLEEVDRHPLTALARGPLEAARDAGGEGA